MKAGPARRIWGLMYRHLALYRGSWPRLLELMYWPVLQMIVQQPIYAAARDGQFDIIATVSGGGLSGQAGALRHGISKALTYYEPGLRGVLKKLGFLTRDSRVVERKKYGKRKARRSFQFSKR